MSRTDRSGEWAHLSCSQQEARIIPSHRAFYPNNPRNFFWMWSRSGKQTGKSKGERWDAEMTDGSMGHRRDDVFGGLEM